VPNRRYCVDPHFIGVGKEKVHMNQIHEATDLLKRRAGTLKLSVSVLGSIVERDPTRALAWTYGISAAADRLSQAVEQLDTLSMEATSSAPPPESYL